MAPRWGGRSRGGLSPSKGSPAEGRWGDPRGAPPRRPPGRLRVRAVHLLPAVVDRFALARAKTRRRNARGDRDGRGGGGKRAPPLLPRRLREDWGTKPTRAPPQPARVAEQRPLAGLDRPAPAPRRLVTAAGCARVAHGRVRGVVAYESTLRGDPGPFLFSLMASEGTAGGAQGRVRRSRNKGDTRRSRRHET